ncbi:M23 family metallopeptidase [Microbacterium sp. Sa4CUA7]|uniref:M23 family metallopeptidase n=1 Tax=Microbacterium pullorum TaxID=2762236 RepID=A0ABR8RZF6_9MICO|nr:M23 family metallopeptidase [Microbacterium pullorum]MBD7956601.1 M23 family metallopeptidase [Microbacterium pullorum]
MPRRSTAGSALVTAFLLVLVLAGGPAAAGAAPAAAVSALPVGEWAWPMAGARLEAPFRAPAHRYGPGHRGIDLAAAGSRQVVAPADGVVAFVGDVAGRPVMTIDQGGGLVTTFEPVAAVVGAGQAITRGETVAHLASGGHTRDGALHVGVRLHGEYLNPMLLFADVPRAVLLPVFSAVDDDRVAGPVVDHVAEHPGFHVVVVAVDGDRPDLAAHVDVIPIAGDRQRADGGGLEVVVLPGEARR